MLEILYQDEWLVAVNKPSGWLVHRSWLDRDEKVVVMQTVRDQIASALGKRTSRSEAVRLVPLRLSTSGSVSYDAAYTHPAPVRLPLSSSQSTYEEVTSSYHNMPGSCQDNGYEDSQISALLPIYYQ